MSDRRTHTPAEIAELERRSGLYLVGFLACGAPELCLPILGGRKLSEAGRRELVAKLNERGIPVLADPPQVEPSKT